MQLSIVALVLGALVGGISLALAGLLFPPTFLLFPSRLAVFGHFTLLLLPWAAGGAALGFAAAWLLGQRAFSAGAAATAGLIAALIAGEVESRSAMCAEALALGAAQISRHGLLWSLLNTPKEWQFDSHARLERADGVYFWSYGDMAGHLTPPVIAQNIDAPPQAVTCAP